MGVKLLQYHTTAFLRSIEHLVWHCTLNNKLQLEMRLEARLEDYM